MSNKIKYHFWHMVNGVTVLHVELMINESEWDNATKLIFPAMETICNELNLTENIYRKDEKETYEKA